MSFEPDPDDKVIHFQQLSTRIVMRELKAMREDHLRLMALVERMSRDNSEFRGEMQSSFAKLGADVRGIRSDVAHLEMQDTTRHHELMVLMRKIDGLDDDDLPLEPKA